jgi:predicted NBD/HSP70 family sugar kinase
VSPLAVCIEVGGGSSQTVVFDEGRRPAFHEGAVHHNGAPLLLAVPGLIDGGRVVAASNLGWFDVDPVEALGLRGPAKLVANDAEAAALGECALRGGEDLAYLGLGTGIGGAIVLRGSVVRTEVFGHRPGYSTRRCSCGRIGCLETVAAGWALPDPVPADRVPEVAAALARAVDEAAAPDLVVVAGGLARANPAIIEELRTRIGRRRVEGSAAPEDAKSAAAWGLLRLAGLDAEPGPGAP